MITAEIFSCLTCGHPVKRKDGQWRHTYEIDGHTYASLHCRICYTEGKKCNLPAAGEEIGLTGTKHAGKEEIQVSTAKKEIVCHLCPEQFANQADLMRHYRENHPIDRDRLLKLRMEGKSPEQIAIIMERSPSTVRYHLEKSSRNDPKEDPPKDEYPPSEGETEQINMESVRRATEVYRSVLEAIPKKDQKEESADGWTKIFHVESSGEGGSDGVKAVRDAFRSALPYSPDSISMDVEKNKELHATRISVRVVKK